MHTYSTDNDIRPKVYGVIALVAYGVTIAVDLATTALSSVLPLSLGIALS